MKLMHRSLSRCLFVWASMATPVAFAQNGNWTSLSGGNWSNNSSWTPAVVPGNAAGNIVGLTSNITSNITVTIDTTPRTVGSLTIGDSNNSNFFTLSASGGGSLTLNNGGSGATMTEQGTNATADVISAPLILADSLSVAVPNGLTLSGNISETGGARSLTKSGSGTLSIGGSGNNTFSGNIVVNGGTLIAGKIGAFGTSNASRTITISNATVSINAANVFGAAGAFSTDIPAYIINSGGTLTNSAGLLNTQINDVTLNGGTITASGANGVWRSWNINGTVTSTGSSFILNGTAGANEGFTLASRDSPAANTNFDVQSGNLTVSARVYDGREGTGPFTDRPTGLTKLGNGTMILSGNNSYSGLTNVNAGTLLVSNVAGSGVGSNNVVVNGGTLGGVGFVGVAGNASNVSFGANGGTIAPGASTGNLTVYGDVNFTTAGTASFAVELNGLTVGTQYDRLVVNSATGGTNTINLADALLSVSLGFTPSMDDAFTILLNNTPSAITGTFNGLANNATFAVNTTTFRINYDAGSGNDIVITVVPEPESLAMMACGVASLWCIRKRLVRRFRDMSLVA